MLNFLFNRSANFVDQSSSAAMGVWAYCAMSGYPHYPWWLALIILFGLAALSAYGEAELTKHR